jgi:hypothetical protein
MVHPSLLAEIHFNLTRLHLPWVSKYEECTEYLQAFHMHGAHVTRRRSTLGRRYPPLQTLVDTC